MSCLFDILSKQSKGEPYSCVRVYLYIFSNLLEKKNRSTELTGRKHLQKWHRFTTTQKFGQKERKKTREKKNQIYICVWDIQRQQVRRKKSVRSSSMFVNSTQPMLFSRPVCTKNSFARFVSFFSFSCFISILDRQDKQQIFKNIKCRRFFSFLLLYFYFWNVCDWLTVCAIS